MNNAQIFFLIFIGVIAVAGFAWGFLSVKRSRR